LHVVANHTTDRRRIKSDTRALTHKADHTKIRARDRPRKWARKILKDILLHSGQSIDTGMDTFAAHPSDTPPNVW